MRSHRFARVVTLWADDGWSAFDGPEAGYQDGLRPWELGALPQCEVG